jgi:hypothetical protein
MRWQLLCKGDIALCTVQSRCGLILWPHLLGRTGAKTSLPTSSLEVQPRCESSAFLISRLIPTGKLFPAAFQTVLLFPLILHMSREAGHQLSCKDAPLGARGMQEHKSGLWRSGTKSASSVDRWIDCSAGYSSALGFFLVRSQPPTSTR